MRERFIIEVDRTALFNFLADDVKTPDGGINMIGKRIVESLLAGEVSLSDAAVMEMGSVTLTKEGQAGGQ